MPVIVYIVFYLFFKYRYDKNLNIYVLLFLFFLYITLKEIKIILIFYCLIFNCISDLYNNDVYTIANLIILLILIINRNVKINYSFIYPIILYIFYELKKNIGLGDIELIFILCFKYSLFEISKILLIASFLNIIYAFLIKKNKYAFVPFISLGVYINYYLNHQIF